MSDIAIALDESGDLGWRFEAPYRKGGSSRFLTIASILYPRAKEKYPVRLIRDMYNRFGWPPRKEVKWSGITAEHRREFSERLKKLVMTHPDIRLLSITVDKRNVDPHIRADGNKLYNYMIGLLLLDEMVHHDNVLFMPDERSIKVKSGNSLHDYLQLEL